MIIVDPARKASIVPGSFSWKFIQDSAKNGKLEDPENYLAGPPAGTARPVGALSATRSTRTPFTAADDKVLAEFVTLAERRGQSVKGNLIYQELERLVSIYRLTYRAFKAHFIRLCMFTHSITMTRSSSQHPMISLLFLTTPNFHPKLI